MVQRWSIVRASFWQTREAVVQDSRLQGVAKGRDPAAHFAFTGKALETQARCCWSLRYICMCGCMASARQDGTPIKLPLLPRLLYAWWQQEKQVQLSKALLLGLHPHSALPLNRGTRSPPGLHKPGQVVSTFFSYWGSSHVKSYSANYSELNYYHPTV